MIIEVPPGTVVCDSSTGDVIADLVSPGQAVVVAAGGRGAEKAMQDSLPQQDRRRALPSLDMKARSAGLIWS